jgi:hypothetical protein
VQIASGSADPGDQSNQNARVSGPLGVGFHRGAVDEALLKIIQTPLENITQLHLMNKATGLIAHRIEVLAQGAGRWQFQAQMLLRVVECPDSKRPNLRLILVHHD